MATPEEQVRASLLTLFPSLPDDGFEVTSPRTKRYNCIAFATGVMTQWWWPDPDPECHWPSDVPMELTLEAFTAAFVGLGFSPCEEGDSDPLWVKIALYAIADEPSHAAVQLADGRWQSKLGKSVDITHTLAGLEGEVYGRVVKYFRRPRISP